METSAPIADVDQYMNALLRIRDQRRFQKTRYLDMLLLHCSSPDHKITAARLATELRPQLNDFKAALLQYGKLGHYVADELSFVPPRRAKGSTMWWQALSTGPSGVDDTDGNFEWTMRPELVAALREMQWAK